MYSKNTLLPGLGALGRISVEGIERRALIAAAITATVLQATAAKTAMIYTSG